MTKAQRKACGLLVARGVFATKAICRRAMQRRRKPLPPQAKIRSCSPSDKGVKSILRRVSNLRYAISERGHADPGRAEMWSAQQSNLLDTLRKRCGYRRGTRLYMRRG